MPLIKPNQIGQKHPSGTVIHKQADGGVGRIMCPRCHQPASQVPGPNGKPVYRCPRGHQYTSSGG